MKKHIDISRILNTTKRAAFKIGGIAIMALIAEMFDIPVTPVNRCSFSCDSVKTAIDSIYAQSEDTIFDSDRLTAAKNICQIVTGSVNNSNVQYAIAMLGKIAENCNFQWNKNEIQNLIVKLCSE